MERVGFIVLLFFVGWISWAQEIQPPIWQRVSDTLALPFKETPFFDVVTRQGDTIPAAHYRLDWEKQQLIWLQKPTVDTIAVHQRALPSFLTTRYSAVKPEQLLTNEQGAALVQLQQPLRKPANLPFDGLDTKGSLTRGITVGNRQNAVTNSSLDLQITGAIAPNVFLRASLQDANLPLQDGGYSQKLDEFDQIFIELFSDNWKLRAGDLFLSNRKSRFVNFDKKVQGLSATFQWENERHSTQVFGAGAVVRGQYAKTELAGMEGNQGPYRLRGNQGALYIMVVSGSERVYVNGRLLTRGEDRDYVIDYNAGEITFTSLFPITSEMRIAVEYQFSERYYTRLLAYGGFEHKRKYWNVGANIYAENDIKNQPLQQTLTPEQLEILRQAGDDPALMMAPSAQETAYNANQILYAKRLAAGVEYFEFSNNPDEVLYQVRFSYTGPNQGNYRLSTQLGMGRVYEYVPAIGGILQGDYEPFVQLIAPNSLQVASLQAGITPSESTNIELELGVSKSDNNLFSSLDDSNNIGTGLQVKAEQKIAQSTTTKWQASAEVFAVQKSFQPIERLYTIEFNRDWNLTQANLSQRADQVYSQARLVGESSIWGTIEYGFDYLDYQGVLKGNRHHLNARGSYKNWDWLQVGSSTQTTADQTNSNFVREDLRIRYRRNANWIGGRFAHENNQIKVADSSVFSPLSQRYNHYQAFVGRGDSTAVYAEAGVIYRTNDSVRAAKFERVNHSWQYYLKSRLIQNQRTQLQAWVAYRQLYHDWEEKQTENTLNSRLQFSTRFWGQWVVWQTAYENVSGRLAQQEFSFVEVDPGLGVYTWIDYNGNGLQELEEFEVAAFTDQAQYVRVFLPNQVYLPTHQNKLSQTLSLNPVAWKGATGWKGFISKFYNQAAFSSEVKLPREGNGLDLNPISSASSNVLAMSQSLRNTLYFNRGLQRHSFSYTYMDNQAANTLNYGKIAQSNRLHQLQYAHKMKESWLVQSSVSRTNQRSTSEQYSIKNYFLEGWELQPKLGYLWAQNTSWDVFYNWKSQQNREEGAERLRQHQLGTQFQITHWKKFTANGALSYIYNDFEGSELSAVGYTMMEGLMRGENWTWRLLLQHNLTSYLEVNVNYNGRKSENSATIHTGSVQLRAFF